MRKSYLLLPLLGLLLGAAHGSFSDYQKPTHAELMARVPQNPQHHCTSHNGMPDKACTPGSYWTRDRETICKGGSTKLIRPSSSYTTALKIAQIAEYGFGDVDPADYEEDHMISLELGGHPDDPRNLWPEPHDGKYGSGEKDKVENWLHKQICSGAMSVEEAQDGIATNWKQYLSKVPPRKPKRVRERP